jgi:hypothetical protein
VIKRFSTLYVGHIELERCGFSGTPADRSWLCGPPEAIVAYLKEVERRYPGLEHIMIAWALGTPKAHMIEQLIRFAREVMPAFRR